MRVGSFIFLYFCMTKIDYDIESECEIKEKRRRFNLWYYSYPCHLNRSKNYLDYSDKKYYGYNTNN